MTAGQKHWKKRENVDCMTIRQHIISQHALVKTGRNQPSQLIGTKPMSPSKLDTRILFTSAEQRLFELSTLIIAASLKWTGEDEERNPKLKIIRTLAALAINPNYPDAKPPKYDKVYCSQCGDEFGPRDSGYSRCSDHQPNQ